ncbi:MAG: HEAT repeat domain-containing protein, partial [Planctomycetota bacterium]
EYPPEEFPTLQFLLYRKRYDTPEHHFHEPDSTGASCVECHMPSRNYMVVDPRRDHGFRVPRPDLTVTLGVPNACNDCHDDRSAEWAADQVAEWYGTRRRETPHFAEAFTAARRGRPEALPALLEIAGDAEQAGIVRATALMHLRGYGPEGLAAHVAALDEADPLIRATAVAGLENAPPAERVAAVAPMLRDPVGAVRFEAARVLAPVSPDLLSGDHRQALNAAIDQYRGAQLATSDLPAGRLNVGRLHDVQGRPDLAEASYRTALRMDAAFLPASFNLANLYNGVGRNDAAEGVLRDALERYPDEGELHYSLGLLLAEESRLAEAAAALGRAAELLPDRARIQYNRALALQQLGELGEAESVMLTAHATDPADVDIVYALVIMYGRQRRHAEALEFAERLLELAPDDPGIRQLVAQVRAAAG